MVTWVRVRKTGGPESAGASRLRSAGSRRSVSPYQSFESIIGPTSGTVIRESSYQVREDSSSDPQSWMLRSRGHG